MALTKSTDLTYGAVTRYEKAYIDLAMKKQELHAQFVDWEAPIPDEAGFAATIDWPIFGELDPVDTALTEDADVVPESINDYNTTLTPYEYGKVVGKTQLASFKSRYSVGEQMARMVNQNRVNSVDRLIRNAIVGRGSSYPTNTQHIDSSVAMSSLTAGSSTDLVTWAFLNELRMHAQTQGIEPVDGNGNYVSVIHPLLEYDLLNLTEFKSVGYYQDRDNIYAGEIGMLGGVRFIVSPQARVYLGAGTALQAATTLNGAVAKGATSVVVTSATGFAVGDYVTIGTLETESVSPGANLEQVLITAVNSTTLTIRGQGDGTSFGCRFAHASGESIVEAYNVCAIPILGRGSVKGVFASRTGRYGQAITKEGLDLLNRFIYYGWYWFGGFARVEKQIILGKVAVSKWMRGYN